MHWLTRNYFQQVGGSALVLSQAWHHRDDAIRPCAIFQRSFCLLSITAGEKHLFVAEIGLPSNPVKAKPDRFATVSERTMPVLVTTAPAGGSSVRCHQGSPARGTGRWLA